MFNVYQYDQAISSELNNRNVSHQVGGKSALTLKKKGKKPNVVTDIYAEDGDANSDQSSDEETK